MANDVRIGVGVNDSASSALDKIRDKFDQLGASKGAQSILMGVGLAAGQMAFNALGQAAGKAIDVVTGSVDAAKQMEVAQAKLDQALRNTGSSYAANASAIEEVSKKGVDLGFTDDAIIDGMARLVTATGSTAKAAYAMGVAQDLARFKGVSLEEATAALTKIEGGRFRGLDALGIVLKKGMTIQEALTAVESRAAGQKEAFAATEVGAWDRVGAKWDQVKEQIGNSLLGPLKDLGTLLADNMPEWLASFGRGWDKVTTAMKAVVDVDLAELDALQKLRDESVAGGARLFKPTTDALGQMADGIRFVLGPLAALNDFMFDKTPPAAAAAAQGVGAFGDASLEAAGKVVAAARQATAFGDASLAAAAVVSAAAEVAASKIADAHLAIVRAYVDSTQASQKWSTQFRLDLLATAPALNTAKADFNTFLDTLGVGPERAKLQGELTGAKLAAGLKTGTVASRAAGAALVKTLTDQLAGLSKPMSAAAQMAELAGEKVTLEHARGMAKAAGDPTRMALIDTALAGVSQKMINLGTLTYTYGLNTAGSWAGGIIAGVNRANPQIAGAIAHITGLFKASSPPGPESPLHEIDKWGERTTGSWVDGMVKGLGKSGISGALAGLAPSFAGGGGGGFGGGSGGGGLTVHGPLVQYSPQLSTASAGEMESAVRKLGPAIVSELRNRGLIDRGSY